MRTKWQRLASFAASVLAVTFALFLVEGNLWFENQGVAQTRPRPSSVRADFDQKSALAKLRQQIKGREKEPANKVFKNIQMQGWTTASHVVAAMEIGYALSLGVNCTHCHTPGKWESDEKNAKIITREMAVMQKTINAQLLKNIKGLKSKSPTINCTTCHRGQVIPALNLPEPPSKL